MSLEQQPEVHDKFSTAARWVLWFVVLGIFGLGSSDSFRAGNLAAGCIYLALFALAFVVGVKWRFFAATMRSNIPHLMWAFLAIFILAAVFALGAFVGHREFATPASVGSVVWNLEQTANGAGYFLNMQKLEGQEVRVTGFGAHGRNNTNKPIDNFSGYLRSEMTNERMPLYVMAQDADETKLKMCFAQAYIPTLPQETYGIPAFADFDISSFEKPITLAGVDGMPLSKFTSDFVPFTLVLEYSGTKYERRYSKEEVQNQVALFERSYTPQSVPRVMRRATAKQPPPPPLVTILPPTPPKNPLAASPIPSVGLPKIPSN